MNIRLAFGTVVFMIALLPGKSQTPEQRVTGPVRPTQTVEERVSGVTWLLVT